MFLTIVDDFTRSALLFLIKNKSSCFKHIIQMISFIGNQFNTIVKIVRSNNTKELSDEDILKFYHSKGILHQKSRRYTSQQNGAVERKNKHLLETARSLQFLANVPCKFLG